jgi:hypothetical protein
MLYYICQTNSLCCDMFMLYYICQSNSLCCDMFMLYCICQSNSLCCEYPEKTTDLSQVTVKLYHKNRVPCDQKRLNRYWRWDLHLLFCARFEVIKGFNQRSQGARSWLYGGYSDGHCCNVSRSLVQLVWHKLFNHTSTFWCRDLSEITSRIKE